MNYRDLINYLDQYLNINSIQDYGPQGLQVEAEKESIKRIALAVDSAPATIKAAVEWHADMLLVHHGIFWRNIERISGPLGERVRLLIKNNVHLYAAHLALDAHPEVGNNATLARLLDMPIEDWWCEVMGVQIGVTGQMDMPLAELSSRVNKTLKTQTKVLNHGPERVKRLAIVSGFGADRVAEAKALGADTFLTGETSHANYWSAADYGMNVIYAGHYATETVGVQELGHHLTEKFGVMTRFFDFPTNM